MSSKRAAHKHSSGTADYEDRRKNKFININNNDEMLNGTAKNISAFN